MWKFRILNLFKANSTLINLNSMNEKIRVKKEMRNSLTTDEDHFSP
jgi:hypothetical protein